VSEARTADDSRGWGPANQTGIQRAPRPPGAAVTAARWYEHALPPLFGIALLVAQLSVAHPAPVSRMVYVSLLGVACSWSAVLLRPRNGPYSMLVVFLAVYFALFGLGPLTENLGLTPPITWVADSQSAADLLIFVGLVVLVTSFVATSALSARVVGVGLFASEWPRRRGLIWATLFWLVGQLAFIQAFVISRPGEHKIVTVLGIPQNVLTNLTTIAIFGATLIAYYVIRRPTRASISLLVAIGILNFALGFWANTKEQCLILPVLVLLVSLLQSGRIPWRALILVAAIMVPFQWVFDARRSLAEDFSPVQLLHNIGPAFERIGHNLVASKAPVAINARVVKERVDGHQYVAIIIDGINHRGKAYQDGYTLDLFWASFVPRFMWPDKPEVSTGKLFNNTFQLSESPLTYIPSTQLGEWYWNFGVIGVIGGMLLTGAVLGLLNRSLDLSTSFTAPRVVAFVAIVYLVIVRFEANIALQYAALTRGLVMLSVMHFLLRERRPVVSSLSRPAQLHPHLLP
jgi:hypothetical protein